MSEPTLRNVAELAKVHPGTASRALNPKTRDMVNAQTVQRVLNAATKLGYRPNSLARALKTNRTQTIGMLIPDLTNPLFPPIVRGVEQALEGAGYTTLLANTDNDPVREQAAFSQLQGRQVDGFLIATSYRKNSFLKEAYSSSVPIVLINRTSDDAVIPAVVGDDQKGTEDVISHLTHFEHTQIAYISGPLATSTGYERLRAFRFSMQASGLAVEPEYVVEGEGYSTGTGYDGVFRLKPFLPRISAIVCGNDMIALGALDALAELGIQCPDEISIVGYNDMPFLDRLKPSLTTVHVPQHDMGAEAARLLLRRFEDPDAAVTTVTLPTRLVVRESTGPARKL